MSPITRLPKKSKGLIRSLNRAFARDDKSPQVVRKVPVLKEPTICERCGAVFLRKTWRRDHKLNERQIDTARWGVCPACDEKSAKEGQGRVILRGTGAMAQIDLIRRRIANVEKRAAFTQPERRLVSVDTAPSDPSAIEVLTTSHKLAHRIVHELRKLLGGQARYSWQDDGTLFATWEYNLPKKKKTPARKLG